MGESRGHSTDGSGARSEARPSSMHWGRTLLECSHRQSLGDSSTRTPSGLAGHRSPLPLLAPQLVVVDDQEADVGITRLGIRQGLRIARPPGRGDRAMGGGKLPRPATRRTFVAILVRVPPLRRI